MTTLYREAATVMRNAVDNGVIDTVLEPFQNPLVAALLDWTEDRRSSIRQDPGTFEQWEHPKSLRWQDSSFEPEIQPTGYPFNPFWMVELAQFAVPKGQVGFVRVIEQVLNDADQKIFPTNHEYWGSPTFGVPDIDNCRWYLTLDYFAGTAPARFSFGPGVPFLPSVAPGQPYTDLFEIPALWYPANSPETPLKLIVPGNRVLRLFFFCQPTQMYRWQVRGRLAGFVQSTYCDEAAQNARLIC